MAAQDARAGYLAQDSVDAPARRLFAITPSDSSDLTYMTKGIFVGGAGNISIQAADDSAPVTLTAIAAGTILPIRASRVYSTGTTASLIVGLA